MRNRSRAAAKSAKLILQIGLMITALFAVIGLMGFFETAKFKDQIGLLIGAEPASKAWVWCPQGVQSLELVSPSKSITDPHQIAVLCSIRIKPSSAEEIARAEFKPLMKARSGSAEVIVEEETSSDLFRINGLGFHSSSFRTLIDRLKLD